MREIPADTDRQMELPKAATKGLLNVREFRLGQFAVETLRAVLTQPNGDPPHVHHLQLNEPSLIEATNILRQISASNANVLISGESGTGKESIAQLIHVSSTFAEKPFKKIDCAGIPASRIYEALFGSHAATVKPLISLCDEGNVFWDEIFTLPESAQDRLLRAVQSRTFKAHGDRERTILSARFLSSTNRNVEGELQAGRFRTDLYDCLATIRIHLNSLREQPADILPLADYYLERMPTENAKPRKFHQAVRELFQKYSWPGNLRQLKQTVEQAAHAASNTVLLSDLPAPMLAWAERNAPRRAKARPASATAEPTVVYDRDHVQAVLKRHAGSVKTAAEELGVSRQGFYKMLKRHSISPEDFRG